MRIVNSIGVALYIYSSSAEEQKPQSDMRLEPTGRGVSEL